LIVYKHSYIKIYQKESQTVNSIKRTRLRINQSNDFAILFSYKKMRTLITSPTEAHWRNRDGDGSPLHLMTLPAVADMAAIFFQRGIN